MKAADLPPREQSEVERCSYADFGTAFVRAAVTPERITSVVSDIAGSVINVGPIDAGPGGVAKATASGKIGAAAISVSGDEPLVYCVRLPVDLDIAVDVAGTKTKFSAKAEVPISFEVHTARPLAIVIEPQRVSSRDVVVRKVKSQGIQGKVLAMVGDAEGEMRRHIARYVNSRVDGDDAITRLTQVDLLPLMEATWPSH
jgi:hypothetical protein